jgi:transcriptional regulator with XRE-family HTH domain
MRVTCQSRIKKLRKQHNLSQKGIAFILQIPPRTYSDYETGSSRVPLDVLIDLAKYYDVDLNYITGISNIRKEYPHA